MALCAHLEIDTSEYHEDGMHWSGWSCRSCDHLAAGESHHRSWCRSDFCGAEPEVLLPERELVLA